MGVKVATTCLQWSQSSVPHSPSHVKRRSVVCRFVHRLHRPSLLGAQPAKLSRSRSCEFLKPQTQTMRRAFSANLDSFSDDDFLKRIEDLALSFQEESENSSSEEETELQGSVECDNGDVFLENQRLFDSDWAESIERKANSVDFPMSLRMIKRKKQWREGFREAGELTYCSVKKAFSNMVLIIRELHSYTLQMREMLYYEDLQGILERVQREMHASFVWLFQQVFSHTPTLMVYVMILLANFSVHSMSSCSAFAAAPPPLQSSTEEVSVVEDFNRVNQKFDLPSSKTFSVSSSDGKSVSIGGSNGGGGKYRPVAGGTDGDERFEGAMVFDGSSSIANPTEEELSSDKISTEEEKRLWRSILEEVSRMEYELRDEALDRETMRKFVSPVTAKMESDGDDAGYFKTDLLYQSGLAQEPNNTLLLANYAQFLYVVVQDYDRAESYFKKAAEAEPKDAEALNKYATFLWRVKNDLWAAEEAYQAAIDAEPDNSFYAANYAHFLWNTGGEDTCFPLDDLDDTENDV